MQQTKLLGFVLASAVFCGTAIAGEGKDRTKTYYSRTSELGDGTVRTYVTVLKDKDAPGNHKVPLAIGVEMSADSFTGLPEHGEEHIIEFPNAARDTPFQYMMFHWNPHGHPPMPWQLPHFDFHFYIQDLDEVMAIRPGTCGEGINCEDFVRATKPVPPQFMPAGYIDVGAAVPKMGNHLIDPLSPEFGGATFTHTFIYGSYDGHISFYEPMITKAYLESLQGQAKQCAALKLSAEYEESGYYPTKYCSEYDAQDKVYRVSIEDFRYRTAPPASN